MCEPGRGFGCLARRTLLMPGREICSAMLRFSWQRSRHSTRVLITANARLRFTPARFNTNQRLQEPVHLGGGKLSLIPGHQHARSIFGPAALFPHGSQNRLCCFQHGRADSDISSISAIYEAGIPSNSCNQFNSGGGFQGYPTDTRTHIFVLRAVE